MVENETLNCLKKSKLFQGLDDIELKDIISFVMPAEVRYQKNQIIVNQGDPVNSIGILRKGTAISSKNHFNGNIQILRIYGQGEIFSLDAVNTTLLTSPVTLVSQAESSVIFVPFLKIFRTDQISLEVKKIIMSNSSEILSNELIRLMYKIDVLSKKDTAGTNPDLFKSDQREESGCSTFDIDMTQDQLAQYLCVNRSVLSKELNQMRKCGKIDYKKKRFTIY
ncbi:Crp/Fnr family transcriptional regulator [uncultured Sphaerochaeta sp.]|uniref:Crp/Fnr family transcriptional regulator n=1 Tax=uncultured Sphaerochaeta sp. TaxID=886478 RepID=UPI002A0A67B0|nr:Crp/Fnr family transcriptional regulator [uncultured Sphaerochaeta sp.]